MIVDNCVSNSLGSLAGKLPVGGACGICDNCITRGPGWRSSDDSDESGPDGGGRGCGGRC